VANAVDVAVTVDVVVIEPVAVAALGNGNAIVDLIDAVDGVRSLRRRSPSAVHADRAFTASATPTAAFPLTSAATIRVSTTVTNTATIT